jgi:hypothetical protein
MPLVRLKCGLEGLDWTLDWLYGLNVEGQVRFDNGNQYR